MRTALTPRTILVKPTRLEMYTCTQLQTFYVIYFAVSFAVNFYTICLLHLLLMINAEFDETHTF